MGVELYSIVLLVDLIIGYERGIQMSITLGQRIGCSIGNIDGDNLTTIRDVICEEKLSKSITHIFIGNVLITLAKALKYTGDQGIIFRAETLIASLMGDKLGCEVTAKIGYSALESVHVSVTVLPI